MPAGRLIRFKIVNGKVCVIPHGTFAEGRGSYVCPSEDCLKTATRKNLFSRALKSPVSALSVEIDLTKEG